jgi:alpha-ketoglutarate-dependent taurine dioxygenase
MKVSKIPGCGSYGVFIDDVDFNTMSDDEWMEIGKIHMKELVTIIRKTNLTRDNYHSWMKKWGDDRMTFFALLKEKYPNWDGKISSIPMQSDWDQEDIDCVLGFSRVVEGGGRTKGHIIRVSGKKDEHGNPLGMFAEGELLWHSNESGNPVFAPNVSLLGVEGTTKSATGFLTTVDYYESVSESFRSELNDMVLLHNFTPGKINPGLNGYQDNMMYKNMAPFPNEEIPMVIKSPYGHVGLHYSFNTVTAIKDMSQAESDKLLEKIRKELEVPEYIYDHWYEQDGDLCLFDNSITQHRRLGETDNRLCLRYQYDPSHLQTEPWIPYLQQPYIDRYIDRIHYIVHSLKGNASSYKLPNKTTQELA